MKKYKWMEDCLVVDGYLRSCIYDLTRLNSHLVDKNTTALIQKIERLDSETVEDNLNDQELEWFHFFLKKELLFKLPSSQMKYLQKIPLRWTNPSKIMSCIIENSKYLPKALTFLSELNCKHLIVSFQNSQNIRPVLEKYFKTTFLRSLDIIVEKNEKDMEYYKTLLADYPLLIKIFIKASSKKITPTKKSEFRRIVKVQSTISEDLVFTISNKIFMESQFHNVYLNRKLFIDKKGDLFNTPESKRILGNINEVAHAEDLYSLSKAPEWNSRKSNTVICEDCEFRNMCIDNRIPVYSEIHNKWYHETECDYNPYIGLWKDEEGHRSLNDCGVEMSENDLKIDKTKLDSINKVLWDNDN